ncbi:MAG: hypothetical protein DRN00_01195, partial [Thermoplasmata archaeon]
NRTDIPSKIILFVLVVFTACTNFVDIKDYEGDRKAGIKTLPTILNLKRSKVIISLFFVIGYLALAISMMDIHFLVGSIIFSLLVSFAINRKNYEEKYVFIVYLSSLVLFIIYILNRPPIIPLS